MILISRSNSQLHLNSFGLHAPDLSSSDAGYGSGLADSFRLDKVGWFLGTGPF
jgi:hypothetical protein